MLGNVIVRVDTIEHTFLFRSIPFILIQEAEIGNITSCFFAVAGRERIQKRYEHFNLLHAIGNFNIK